MDKETLDVAIIGGGIGGLACALALQKIGLSVKVFEKDSSFDDRKQGYGLTLTNSQKGALAQLGLLEVCMQQNCPSYSHFVFAADGSIIGYFGREMLHKNEEERNNIRKKQSMNSGNLRIPRQDLRLLLLNSLKPDTINWNHKIIDYEENLDYVELKLCINDIESTKEKEFSIKAHVLVGADGIRSVVRQLRDKKEKMFDFSPLKYTGVAVIIGLSEFSNTLVENKGFYVIDGTQRLFTMPFISSEQLTQETPFTDQNNQNPITNHINVQSKYSIERNITMWQLSFAVEKEEEVSFLRGAKSIALLGEAGQRVSKWFPEVKQLVDATLPGEIWGTPLYDRDTMSLHIGKRLKEHRNSRVVVIGDACHPMCMFKGQGANQALADGPLLAKWLDVTQPQDKSRKRKKSDITLKKDNNMNSEENNIDIISNNYPIKVGENGLSDIKREALYTRLRCFEREMVARAGPKAEASRQAARILHCGDTLQNPEGFYGVSGVEESVLRELKVFERLKEAGVVAGVSEVEVGLEEQMKRVIQSSMLESKRMG